LSEREPTSERPDFPDYGIATGHEGLLDWSWAVERLEASRNYWICSTRADGRPHAAPVWGLWLEGMVCFSSGRDSLKARNIGREPEIVVHLESGDEVVIIEGTALRLEDHDLLERFADAYNLKYGFRPDPDGADPTFGVRPRSALGWTESDFPNTATRWRFPA
jgi:hypothetical protein